ncbi:MAG: AbrB/MazE/SpoVT family DNA-binding domain-containing protein [Ruminococcaceae bacterium]|nr:AbrB/MazE/SpoVT family DNA-binding domain-containing protein [Oscillospiraceae bacterium]
MTRGECQTDFYMYGRRKTVSRAIGIIKVIDSLGRIVIPKEMRERLSLGREVELVLTDEGILIRDPRSGAAKEKETEDM